MGMYCVVRAVDPTDVEGQLAAGPEGRQGPGGGEPRTAVSLEKAWHGLHYLLTGVPAGGELPLAFLLEGGEPVGEDDGYGQPRLFAPDLVAELDTALTGVSEDQLWSRFNPEQMEAEGIYPGIWDEPEDDLREEYVGYFEELKKLVHAAAAQGKALVVSIS